MIKITTESLIEFLKKNAFNPTLQKDTGQIVVILKISEQEFPLFFRPFDESGLLQLLVFIPTQIKHGTQNDLARLMHLINKELDIPGLGMDEDSNTCFYRVMLPTIDDIIDERLLKTYLQSIQLLCEQIAPTVIAVANKVSTFEDILRKTKHGS